MFAIVKAISRYEQDLNEDKFTKLGSVVQDLYFKVRRNFNDSSVLQAFSPFHFMDELIRTNVLESPNESNMEAFQKMIQSKIDIINQSEPDRLNAQIREKIQDKVVEIFEIVFTEEDKGTVIKRALRKAFYSEFYHELSPKHQPKTVSELSLSEGENSVFEIKIKADKIDDFDLKSDIFFEDATFIETPIIFQLYEAIRNAGTLLELLSEKKSERLGALEKPKVSLHFKDLMTKIENAQYYIKSEDKNIQSLLKDIGTLIGGEFEFVQHIRNFVFNKRHNGHGKKSSILPVNMASGIKSFGLLQLLIQGGFVNRRSLLIVDEPETHLHPKWQIEYARLLVELVKNEIPVLVTSHSPYFIQALRVFSQKEGIAENTHFYLASENEKTRMAVIEDVTEDLNRLFQKLSEPFQKLVWE